jgi:hypothetical protein
MTNDKRVSLFKVFVLEKKEKKRTEQKRTEKKRNEIDLSQHLKVRNFQRRIEGLLALIRQVFAITLTNK